MSYTRPSLKTIYNRVKADLEAYASEGVPIPRVSLLGIIGAMVAGASHLQHGFLSWLKRQMFIDLADEWGLTRWGNRYGLPRKAATYSSGYIIPTGTAATTVPDETVWVNSEGYEFVQQGDFVIETDDEIEVVASVAGADSNFDGEDAYLSLSSPVADVDSDAETTEDPDTEVMGFDDGTDQEGIETWRLRLLQRSSSPPSSGNKGDYIRWAMEVPGVGRAWCMPAEIWGLGSVGVYVAKYDEENLSITTVPSSILSDVETYIESVHPIPAFVAYNNITPKDTTYVISISPNTTATQEAVEQNLKELHIFEFEPGGTSKISHIRHAIKTAGVDDYEITSIQVEDYGSVNPIGDFTMTYPDIAVYSDATFNDL